VHGGSWTTKSIGSLVLSVRPNDVGDGDLRDSDRAAPVLPDSAAAQHQSGASLLEHVKPYVSRQFSDEHNT